MRLQSLAGVAAGLLLVAPLAAQAVEAKAPKVKAQAEPTLKVGDVAPALTIAEWVKGDAIPALQKDKIYIVEFWATW